MQKQSLRNQLNDTTTKAKLKLIAKTAIFNQDGKILVLTRSETDTRRPGGLDFPGGNVDAGEDILMAASREIKEEVGLDISISDLRMIYTHSNDREDDNKVVLRFLCAAEVADVSAVELSFEHSAYAWMTLDEVLDKFETISWASGLRFALKNNVFLANSLQ